MLSLAKNLIHPKMKRFPTHECLNTTCKFNPESSTDAQIRGSVCDAQVWCAKTSSDFKTNKMRLGNALLHE